MKKVLAVILCVCIALTLSVAVMAESSPQNTVIIRRGVGSKQDGSNIPQDTFVEVSEDNTITIKANEKTYGKFNKWTIYVINDDGEYEEAEEGVDYEIVSGSLEDSTLVIKPIGSNPIAVAGNYNGKITDPTKVSTESDDTYNKSPKDSDVAVIYAVFALLAAGAVVFGAKKQFSK